MSDAYVGEIRMFGGNFAPDGWLMCDGSSQQLSAYQALGTLLGTTYGGDGQTTFNLPDMRGRVPVHQGNGAIIGSTGGVETVTLNAQQLPTHSHAFQGSSAAATATSPSNNVVATSNAVKIFQSGTAATAMSPTAVGSYGGGGSHDNVQPFTCMNFIINYSGYWPEPAS